MNGQKNSFVKGAAILGGIGLLCKVIGALYRIPMTNLIGLDGMAYYQTAYPIYSFLLAISSAGLPVAVSRMVSERVTLGDYKAAHIVFQTAFKILAVLGLVTTVGMLALSKVIANSVGWPDAVYCLLMIAPALFLVSIMSAYRGYFQGLQIMSPTAFSQLIEQVGKLGAGLLMAYLWLPKGVAWSAAGAVLGVTISELLALVFMIILYNRNRRGMADNMRRNRRCRLAREPKPIAKQLLLIALPIVIGSCAMPLVQMVDLAVVTNTLNGMGYTMEQAQSLYGNLTGVVNPLINMPAVLSLALAMSLVPAISSSMAENDYEGMSGKSSFGFKLALLVGLPCAAGFYLLAEQIISLLYTSLTPSELSTSVALLCIMSIAVLFLTVVQTMTGVLQGAGKPAVPVINLLIGVAVKTAVTIIFTRMPEINVMGAAIGTVACYVVAGTLDVIFAIKYAKLRLSLVNHLVRPVLSAGVMGVVIYFLLPVVAEKLSNTVTTLLLVAVGVVVYAVMLLLIGGIKREDAAYIPGGRKLTSLMTKLHLWR